ncbi:membrane fraction protein [Leucosporidium creatinivorum]|uniref:Membrane fraction protein n=1 Tax=Leucosporidium creatinivorum TaxID=106004 RepID=A0A1Y2FA25_9BASI|nr:membrane fraction protein [Leucosporidium creatinivorum]
MSSNKNTYATVAANTHSSSAQPPAGAGSVSLPPRTKPAEGAKPVWSLQAGPGGSDQVPLASKCDQHNRERTICCRDLKGDDERSLIDPDIVRDIIIGLADGLTVPFGLTAGLSSLGSSRLVYVAGVAELVSGALSMGVGGYLSAQAERDHYRFMKKQTRERVQRSCAGEMEREVSAILSPLGVDDTISRRALNAIARRPKFSGMGGGRDEERTSLLRGAILESANGEDDDEKGLTAFLLKFGEGMEETTDSRLFISAITIGLAYFLGGLVPLMPYFFIESARQALYWSIGITTIVLLVFGAFKTFFTGAEIGIRGYTYGSLVTLLVGGAAAGASFGIVRALEGGGGEN